MDNTARDHLQPCFVLHRREFGNTSLILEIFSARHGRQALLAKGAKRTQRGHAARSEVLQPFRPLLLSWSGRGDVKTLLRSEPAGFAVGLCGTTLFCGLYLNELLFRLLQRGDPYEDLFAFYHAALAELAGGTDVETVLRQFELRLLHEIGYSVVLDREAGTSRPVTADGYYIYEIEVGLRPAQPDNTQNTLSGKTLLDLNARRPLTKEAAREAKALARQLLAPHLGPRPLKSRELFLRRSPAVS